MTVPIVQPSTAPRRAFASLNRSAWGAFALRRAGGLVLSFALLVVITFLIVPLIPGDPAIAILGTDATPDSIAAMRTKLNLDEGLATQLGLYLKGVATFEFGDSFRYSVPVSEIISQKIGYTVTLAVGAMLVALIVAVPLGMAVGIATRGGRRPRLGLVFGAVAGFLSSVPAYIVGTVLVIIVAISWGLLPSAGVTDASSFVLPILSLAIGPAFAVARVVRQETAGVLERDYMRTARGKRLTGLRTYASHALPNIMASTLTLSGLILASLLGGAVVTEAVFNIPGLGSEVIRAIVDKDYPVIQGIILTIGSLAILINLTVDIALGVIDPRTLGADNAL